MEILLCTEVILAARMGQVPAIAQTLAAFPSVLCWQRENPFFPEEFTGFD